MQSIACTGARYIGSDSEPLGRRILWIVLALLGMTAVTLQVTIQIQQYFSRPTTVDIREKFVSQLKFPSVTICSESRYDRSKARTVHPDMEKAVDELFPPLYQAGYSQVLSNSTIDIAGDISANWSQIYFNMSGKPSEVIFLCRFKGGPCGPYRPVWTRMGYCFTFNPDGDWTQDGSGIVSGLILVLRTDQANHFVLNDLTSGFRVLVHEPYEFPAMHKGFKADVGQVTLARLKKTEVKLLKAPYGNCESRQLRHHDTYTRGNCEIECMSKAIEDNCNCSSQRLPAYNFNRTCTLLDEKTCVFWLFLAQDQLNCDCPVPCNPTAYSESISSSSLAVALVDYISKFVTKGTVTPSELRLNYATTIIYFPELSYSELKAVEAYTFIDFICDVGGALGLMLGSTFFTLYELVDFVIWGYWEKITGKILE